MPWSRAMFRRCVAGLTCAASAVLVGCGSPSAANIELRKQVQTLQDQVQSLHVRHDTDQATIRGLETSATTVPVLPSDRVSTLFTVHGLRFGRLTGGADLDPQSPGDEGIKVYVVPVDEAGDPLKAAGSFVVRVFDLSDAQDPLIGEWKFPLSQAPELWYGQGLMYEYILRCPWQRRIPSVPKLTLQVDFTDALTQRVFSAKRDIEVQPTPSTPPPRTPQP